ncbi:MAG: hypothetical protein KC964_07595 [Candidatus Omnitrophica bacterium]|nr:hypothetical protein [Candidatus Omnitrophota bacterium]
MWPDWLVLLIRDIKNYFNWFRIHQWMGIPLDLILRFFVLGLVYWIARRKASLKTALLISLAILLGKEVFDTFTVRSWSRIHWPGFLDFEDVMSGVLGMAVAEIVHRLSTLLGPQEEIDEGEAEAVGD